MARWRYSERWPGGAVTRLRAKTRGAMTRCDDATTRYRNGPTARAAAMDATVERRRTMALPRELAM